MEIRAATQDDAEALQRYAERLFTEKPDGIFERNVPTVEEEQEFIASHDSDNSVLLLAVENDEVILPVQGLGEPFGPVAGLARGEPCLFQGDAQHASNLGIVVDNQYVGHVASERGMSAERLRAVRQSRKPHSRQSMAGPSSSLKYREQTGRFVVCSYWRMTGHAALSSEQR